MWYTDGSRMNGLSGAGVHCERAGIDLSVPLGEHCTVFQAEIYAIMMAAWESLRHKSNSRRIYF